LTFNDQGELEPVIIDLSPEAKAVGVAFHDDVEAELKPGGDMAEAKDVASKAADNAARLAALFHLFENGPGGTISAEHMRKAAAVASWHLYETRRFLGEIALPVQLNSAAKLDTWLMEYCRQKQVEEISTRDIQRLGPNCTRGKSALDGVLQELAEAGRVKIVESKRRRLVKINPALLGGRKYGLA
jgi:putative DNA primase/helicase